MNKNVYILILFIALAFGSCKDKGEAPVITILGSNPAQTGAGYPYHDAGATAADAEDGDLTNKIITSGFVDTSTVGTYYIRYNVSDSDGNDAEEATREVVVKYFK